MIMNIQKYSVGIDDRNIYKQSSAKNKECKKLCCMLIYSVNVFSGYYLTLTTLTSIKVILWIIIPIT